MPRPSTRPYLPDYVVAPGESLKEALEDRTMTQAELARRTGRPLKTISEIVNGKSAITPETALQFERVLGISAAFWNNLETNFRADRARLAEREEHATQVDWLDIFPIPALRKREILSPSRDKAALVGELLRFFGVSTVAVWHEQWAVANARYRKAVDSQAGATAVWLRLGDF